MVRPKICELLRLRESQKSQCFQGVWAFFKILDLKSVVCTRNWRDTTFATPRNEKINYKKLGGEKSHSYSQIYAFEDSKTQKLVSFSLLDGEGQTGYLTYDGNNTDVYYSDVEVLAIMQAPPLRALCR